jgi:RNA polymerase sigma-70 factor (ECF subfamily)
LVAGTYVSSSLTVTELFEEYRERLTRYANSLTHDSARADDLVQETFIQAMTHITLLNQLHAQQRQTWLYQVLKNRFLDQLRAYRRKQALFEQLAHQSLNDDTFSPAAALPYELFDLVPLRYRDLLRKRYILGLNSEEIGKGLGIPAATVRSRLRLAIEWLRAHQSEFI